MNVKRILGRITILGLSALICGFASASASLLTLLLSLPPTDGAYGMTLWESWSSPVVGPVAMMATILGAIIWFAFALGLLWRTNLKVTIPITLTTTILTAALFGFLGPFAAVMALLIGITAMATCMVLDVGDGSMWREERDS